MSGADSLLVIAATDGREIGRVPAPKSLAVAQGRLRALQRRAARQQGPWDPGAKAKRPPSKRWARTIRRIGATRETEPARAGDAGGREASTPRRQQPGKTGTASPQGEAA
jgi:putative transposase